MIVTNKGIKGENMSRKSCRLFCMTLLLTVLICMPALAGWKKSGSTYVYYKDGVKQESTWFADKQFGFVKIGYKTFCYNLDGSIHTGLLTAGGDRYYVDRSGKVLKKQWITYNNRRFRAGKDMKLYRSMIVKVGSYRYGFNKYGVMVTGKATFAKKTYFFSKSTGRMQQNTYVISNKKRYFCGADGVVLKNAWKGKYYFGSDGVAVINTWIGDKYCGADGKYLTGLHKIDGTLYYFQETGASKGKKVTSRSMEINGAYYQFDSEGKGKCLTDDYEVAYFTDPKVSDETLLAAIIYCEAGNQPYFGQVAVGLVIMNRINSSMFPNTMRQVIYAKWQFEPARNDSLTRALTDSSIVTASCKKAAAKVLAKAKAGSYTITDNTGKKHNLKDYYFFMTHAAYKRLGMKSTPLTLQDHVFFKDWIR